MPTRLVSLLLILLLIVPAYSQQGIQEQVSQRIWCRGQMMRPDSPPEVDPEKVRLISIHQDAEQLSTLTATLQSGWQQLSKGMLTKDLTENLKKVEKLSKKLRKEVAQ